MKLLSKISAFLPLAVTLIWLQFLPDRVPLHYDASGNIDRWGSKWENLLLPGVVLLMGLVFFLVSKAGLKKAAGDEKALAHAESNAKVIRVVMIATGVMFTVLQAVLLYGAGREAASGATKSSVDLNRVMVILLGFLFLIMGNFMPKAKRNSTVGFRCGWSMYNDVTWQKCNRFAGLSMLCAGVGTILCGVLLSGGWAIAGMVLMLTVAIVVSLVYAAKVYRLEKGKV